MINLKSIISCLTRRILAQALHDLPNEDALTQTTDEVYARIHNMPRFLLLPIIILTIIFDVCGIFWTGHFFRRQQASQQDRQIASWQNSPLGFCRDFIKLYLKTTIFVYYSLPAATESLGAQET